MEEKIKQALIKLGWVNPAGITINLRDDELTIRCFVDGMREGKHSKEQSNCNLTHVSKSEAECKHEFVARNEDLICHKCKWVKYKIEIEAEKAHHRRVRRRSEILRIKNKHIDLFQF